VPDISTPPWSFGSTGVLYVAADVVEAVNWRYRAQKGRMVR